MPSLSYHGGVLHRTCAFTIQVILTDVRSSLKTSKSVGSALSREELDTSDARLWHTLGVTSPSKKRRSLPRTDPGLCRLSCPISLCLSPSYTKHCSASSACCTSEETASEFGGAGGQHSRCQADRARRPKMDMACPWPRTGVGCHDTYSDGVRDTYTGVTIGFAFLVALLLFFASRQLYRVALVRGGLLSLCRRPHTKRTASSPRAVKGFFNTQEMLSVSVFFASLGLVVQVVDPLSWDGVLPRLVFGLCRDWTHAWVFIFS